MAGLRTTGRRAGLDFHFYVSHPLSNASKQKARGLVERLGSSYCYRLTQKGVRVALMFLLFHKGVCGPLADSLFARKSPSLSPLPTKIGAAYRKADTSIQHLCLSPRRLKSENKILRLAGLESRLFRRLCSEKVAPFGAVENN